MTIVKLPCFRPSYFDRTGLIGEWAFWTGHAHDIYGTNNRTVYNATFTYPGLSHTFSKTSYTDAPEISFGTGNFAVEFWARINSYPITMNTYHGTTDAFYDPGGDCISIYSDGIGGSQWRIFGGCKINGSGYYFLNEQFSGVGSFGVDSFLSWHHVVYTVNRSNSLLTRIYVNGIVGSIVTGPSGGTGAELNTIGTTGDNKSDYYFHNGSIGELRYWKKNLTQAQSLNLCNATQWRYA